MKIAIAVVISINIILHIPQLTSAPNPFTWNNEIFIMIYYSVIYSIHPTAYIEYPADADAQKKRGV